MFNLLPLIPAAVSLLTKNKSSGGSSGSGGSVATQTNLPDWQEGIGEDLSSWVQKFLSMYNPGQPYTGRLSASGPTSYERLGLTELGGLLGRPATGDLFGAAKSHILDTLGGKFMDPETSPFIKALSKLAGQNLEDSINDARGRRGARGTYFTRAGIQEESRLSERTQNYLDSVIGDFLNTERGRQFSAVDKARELEGFETDTAVKRVTASQTLGSLERLLEQSDLERQYEAWLNQRNELSGVPGIARSVLGANVPTVTTVNQPRQTTGGQDIAPWISLAMRLIPSLMN